MDRAGSVSVAGQPFSCLPLQEFLFEVLPLRELFAVTIHRHFPGPCASFSIFLPPSASSSEHITAILPQLPEAPITLLSLQWLFSVPSPISTFRHLSNMSSSGFNLCKTVYHPKPIQLLPSRPLLLCTSLNTSAFLSVYMSILTFYIRKLEGRSSCYFYIYLCHLWSPQKPTIVNYIALILIILDKLLCKCKEPLC